MRSGRPGRPYPSSRLLWVSALGLRDHGSWLLAGLEWLRSVSVVPDFGPSHSRGPGPPKGPVRVSGLTLGLATSL